MRVFLSRLFLGALVGVMARGATLTAAERPLQVVTLNTVLTELAREVGGDQVEVKGIVRPGVDPHTFDPSAMDLRAMVDADL
ncbi:MAG: zinc ABC transporter substrate-binding protein, partial [Opitutaceae bacterium]